MKTMKFLQFALASAFAITTLPLTSSGYEYKTECNLPLDVLESTNFHPEQEDTINFVENQYLLSADSRFDGVLSEELQALGILSLEEIFNTGDFWIYCATTAEDSENLVENLENLDLFLSVEKNLVADMLYTATPPLLCDLSPLYDENGSEIGETEIPPGIIYEYTLDEQGNYVVVEEIPAVTETFEPEGEPMPEGTFAPSPRVELSLSNWFTGIIQNIFGFFFS